MLLSRASYSTLCCARTLCAAIESIHGSHLLCKKEHCTTRLRVRIRPKQCKTIAILQFPKSMSSLPSYATSKDKLEEVHVHDATTAEIILQQIRKSTDVTNRNSIFIDNQAGFGVFGETLIQHGCTNVVLCYGQDKYLSKLELLRDRYSQIVTVYNKNFSEPFSSHDSPSHHDSKNNPIHFLDDSHKQRWQKEPLLNLFLIERWNEADLLNRFFLHYLVERQGLFAMGRVKIFLLCRQQFSEVLETRSTSKVGTEDITGFKSIYAYKAHLLYDIAHLGTVPQNGICVPSQRPRKRSKDRLGDDMYMHLLSLTPKANPLGDENYDNHLGTVRQILYLIQQLHFGSQPVLPRLEQILKNAGLEVVSLGYPANVRMSAFTCSDIVRIVQALQRLPHFDTSVLHHVGRADPGYAALSTQEDIKTNPFKNLLKDVRKPGSEEIEPV